MQHRTRLVVGSWLALVVIAASVAVARPGGHPPTAVKVLRTPTLLAQYLQLDPTQVAEQQELFATLRSTLAPVERQQAQTASALAVALRGGSGDPRTVGQLVKRLDSLHKQVQAAYQTFDAGLVGILTPEQAVAYAALKAAAHVPY